MNAIKLHTGRRYSYSVILLRRRWAALRNFTLPADLTQETYYTSTCVIHAHRRTPTHAWRMGVCTCACLSCNYVCAGWLQVYTYIRLRCAYNPYTNVREYVRESVRECVPACVPAWVCMRITLRITTLTLPYEILVIYKRVYCSSGGWNALPDTGTQQCSYLMVNMLAKVRQPKDVFF